MSLAPAIAPLPAARHDQASRLRALFESLGPAPAPSVGHLAADLPAAPAPRHLPILAVASGKGGVGKTSLAVNLAIAMAAHGHRITLLDGDFGVANADVLLGVNPRARAEAVLAPAAIRPTWNDIAVDAPGGIRLIPGSVGLARMADLSAAERRWMASSLCALSHHADALILDTGAGVGPLVRTLVAAADLALIVTTPEPTAIADAYALIKCIRQGGAGAATGPTVPGDGVALGLIVNQAADAAEAAAVHGRLAGVCARFLAFDLPSLGFIPRDLLVASAVRARRPFTLEHPAAPAAAACASLAQKVLPALGLTVRKAGASAPRRSLGALLGSLLRA